MQLLFFLFECLVLPRVFQDQLFYLVLLLDVLFLCLEQLFDLLSLILLEIVLIFLELFAQLYLLHFKFFDLRGQILNLVTLIADQLLQILLLFGLLPILFQLVLQIVNLVDELILLIGPNRLIAHFHQIGLLFFH